ncbi:MULTISPECIES: hypothetical protein [Aerosakkonema]|uniref:hypothetical protein n=1 Tax=Aerosakkonema TaxID=1246629 RepID=UPI0035B7CACD
MLPPATIASSLMADLRSLLQTVTQAKDETQLAFILKPGSISPPNERDCFSSTR